MKTLSSGLSLALVGTFALLFGAPLGCNADGLIGGECADGYAFCDGACISITDDEANCGACNVACPRNLACIDALCGGPDGTITVDGTGGVGMGGMGMGGMGFGGLNVGAGGPGGNDGVGGGVPGTGGGGQCLPPFVTADACGDCVTQCTGATPNCAPDGGGGYECVATCLTDPYTTLCGDSCVDTETDPRHCGDCDNRCASGICVGGDCVGQVSGHMVAMCMSFEEPSPSQTKLLGNAVFLASENPVRILAYVRDTSAEAKSGTDFSLTQAAVAKGRSFVKTEVTGLASVESQLDRADYEVLLVYDQEEAPSGQLQTTGDSWAPVVQTFTELGGVVVVLTGGGGTSEMHELIDALGIAGANGTTNYDGGTYRVSAPGDAVGINVVSPFLAVNTSCTFNIPGMPSAELVFVTTAADVGPNNGDPGVIHRIVTP